MITCHGRRRYSGCGSTTAGLASPAAERLVDGEQPSPSVDHRPRPVARRCRQHAPVGDQRRRRRRRPSTVAMPRTASIGAQQRRTRPAGAASSIVNGPTAVRRRLRRWAPPPSRWPRSAASVRTYVPAEHSTSIASTPGSAVALRRRSECDRDRPRRPLDLDRPRGPARAAGARRPGSPRPSAAPARCRPSGARRPRRGRRSTVTPAMSWVATTVPSASSVSVSTPSTTSPV